MIKLIHFMKDYKKEAILGPIFKLIEAILELFVPIVMAKIIDVGVRNSNISYIFKMGGILILLGVSGLGFALICQYYASVASQGVGTSIRSALFKHINKLSHTEIDKIGAPTLITRLTNDVNQIQTGVAMIIRLGSRTPFIIIGSTIMAIALDLKLSIIFIVTTPLIALVIYFVMSKSLPLYKIIQNKLDNISLITRENLEGTRVIKAFSKEESEKLRFKNASNDLSDTSINVGKISALLNPITYIIMNLSIVAILWFGGIRVNSGSLTQGEVIAFVNYITQILLALIVFAQLVVILTKASTSATRVSEILEIKSTIVEKDNIKTHSSKSEAAFIEFKNVFFSYADSNEYSLSNISLTINKNETIGIIGGTGSGKSTLVNLIPRFYDATKGQVLINGTNVKDYTLNRLRSMIGIVPQKAVLFKGTLMENLKWGKKYATIDEIETALEISQSSSFVQAFPEKYDTNILQSGKNLSGGQKQRLTIARALVSNPEILILDDSSSALDFATDASLRKALKEKVKNTTVIMVSQRASSIKNADKIIVLNNGEIVGIGKHDYLINNCEVYKEICSSQLKN
ncbi:MULTISPECIES: ABC transporter ATP-binding protein [Clostridium]|uniref:ABC transporter ATP-binding protein n=1 Tax=Clostridium TaxID=1485 RepID=UPI001D6F6A1A|nr:MULTISPECIES: ABC transporter ATP-binding protein [Clostridium]MBS5305297.1 ABC transporter ATP-binding protein [Clostridium sp.]MDB1942697.1 ABC transporter ATP-binding protein [Clostridium tertium]MDB1949798.1 ABC transporter ATP-binding protein [Clostridium tertium]MDU1565890.1 ABC transporter ATP-binding protein [Clostridium sp.]MDU4739156.1 ABC transporter ATP-binding protein [Clostridium sp.]